MEKEVLPSMLERLGKWIYSRPSVVNMIAGKALQEFERLRYSMEKVGETKLFWVHAVGRPDPRTVHLYIFDPSHQFRDHRESCHALWNVIGLHAFFCIQYPKARDGYILVHPNPAEDLSLFEASKLYVLPMDGRVLKHGGRGVAAPFSVKPFKDQLDEKVDLEKALRDPSSVRERFSQLLQETCFSQGIAQEARLMREGLRSMASIKFVESTNQRKEPPP